MEKILVIGAGIFGAAAALELSTRGHEVHLFDPGPVPHPDASSTDISKVLRMDYGGDRFYMELMLRAFEGWDRWNERWERPLFHETGVLMLSREAMQPGGYEYESYRLLQEYGIPAERMTPADLRRRFPAWNADRYPDGYFNPRGGWAESGAVVRSLLNEFITRGGAVHEGARIEGWLTRGDRMTGFRTANGESHSGAAVVLAAGAWTPGLLPELAPVMWPTGQDVLHFRAPVSDRFRPPHFPVYTADVSRSGWYGFPALADGTLKIANHGLGRKLDPSGPRQVQAGAEAKFRSFLRDTFPELAGAQKIYERVCFYADTFDGDFLIDRHPVREGLLVASGGSGHAFKFAPVLGGLIADALEEQENSDLVRFRWRGPGKRKTEDARFEGE